MAEKDDLNYMFMDALVPLTLMLRSERLYIKEYSEFE